MSETVNETMNDVTMTDKLTNNDMASNVTGPASSGSEGRSANPSVAMPRVVSIVGPTASGKTGLGIAVARALAERGERAEIVNADAYQMYRGMDIGTAKPTADEQAAVPHHLLDIIDPDEAMSVARFQQVARATIHDLQSRGIRPILVGGSGLYARAAIDDISFPGTDPDVRRRLEERERSEGAGALFDELRAKDPQAASRMDPHNPRRTIRALEVIEVTGRPYSASLPRYRYVIASVQIGLDLPREELDQRIDIRTKQMLEGGFIEEVERIRPHLGATAGRALGYQQVIDYLDGLCDLDDTFRDIAQKTKRLARKQMGWFGRDPRIHWLHALNPRLVDNAMAVIDHADAGDYDPIDAQADEYTQHHLGDLQEWQSGPWRPVPRGDRQQSRRGFGQWAGPCSQPAIRKTRVGFAGCTMSANIWLKALMSPRYAACFACLYDSRVTPPQSRSHPASCARRDAKMRSVMALPPLNGCR